MADNAHGFDVMKKMQRSSFTKKRCDMELAQSRYYLIISYQSIMLYLAYGWNLFQGNSHQIAADAEDSVISLYGEPKSLRLGACPEATIFFEATARWQHM
jgi:hypothetical protein